MDTVDEGPHQLLIYASLGVFGAFEPGELSALLGVEGVVARRGDLRPGGRREAEDSWTFLTTEELSFDWETHLRRVLEVTADHETEFSQFCDQRDLEREVALIAKMNAPAPDGSADTPIGTLPRDVVANLAALGCSLDIDLYCWCSGQS